jgi:hypothetical protein
MHLLLGILGKTSAWIRLFMELEALWLDKEAASDRRPERRIKDTSA